MGERKKILAVSSSGGHWTELLRLRPAFDGHEVVFVTTRADSCNEVPGHRVCIVPDANARSRLRVWSLLVRTLLIVLRERPDIVISTGAAPGYFAIRFGHYLGARTLWLVSIPQAVKLSLSTPLGGRDCLLQSALRRPTAEPHGPPLPR